MKTLAVLLAVCSCLFSLGAAPATTPRSSAQPVKLIFIHHSTGENWLTDGYGDLGRALDQSNYFVSDTNYGWGPDAIGDRTDIPNWVEWFSSSETGRIMQALVNESGQNASYTRTLADPGGENQIILFKSCFPNSDLSGSPQDAPGSEAELSVSGAKFVYNEILQYFATRPDKMFVVITAPPLSDGTHAANARAFNQWLLNDWLRENNYAAGNVFVFDFYNVLTGPNAHHRVANGQVEYTLGERDTLYYPSGDDHPSEAGSQKATAEFVPLLDLFYQRWQASGPPAAPQTAAPTAPAPAAAAGAAEEPPASAVTGLVDDFEGAPPAGTPGWEGFRDDTTRTTIICAPDGARAKGGAQALQMEFEVDPGSWATCALFFDRPQDWSAAEGLAFDLLADSAAFNVILYAGPQEARETYLYPLTPAPGAPEDWGAYQLRWEDFRRAEWEENGGAAFVQPAQVSGVAFGFDGAPDAPNSGVVWVDDLRLASQGTGASQPQAAQPSPEAAQVQPSESAPAEAAPASRLPACGSSALLLLPLALVLRGRKRRPAGPGGLTDKD